MRVIEKATLSKKMIEMVADINETLTFNNCHEWINYFLKFGEECGSDRVVNCLLKLSYYLHLMENGERFYGEKFNQEEPFKELEHILKKLQKTVNYNVAKVKDEVFYSANTIELRTVAN